MALDFSNEETLAITAKAKAFAHKLEAHLRSVDQLDFPTDESVHAQTMLGNALKALIEPSNLRAIDAAVLYNKLHELSLLVDYVESSSTNRISWPLVSYCDAIWKTLFGLNGPKVFFSVTPIYNYTLIKFSLLLRAHLNGLLTKVQIDSILGAQLVYCLQLASSEDDNLPLYANIGHEFGHALFEHHRNTLLGYLQLRIAPIEQLAQTTFTSPNAKRVMQHLAYIVVKFAEELFCDLIGSMLMGPAFLLSLYEVSWGKQNNFCWSAQMSPASAFVRAYPSVAFRLHCIRNWSGVEAFSKQASAELRRNGLEDPAAIVDALASIPRDHSGDSVVVKLPHDGDSSEIQVFIVQHLDALKRALEFFVHDSRVEVLKVHPVLGRSISAPDVAALMVRIKHHILPNVIPDNSLLGRRADFGSILNASALFRLSNLVMSDGVEHLDLMTNLELIERLTAKAFEVSYIHQQFVEWSDHGNTKPRPD